MAQPTIGLPASHEEKMVKAPAVLGVEVDGKRFRVDIKPYAGRIGACQEYVLDPSSADNAELIKRIPDATPFMTLRQSFNLHGFRDPELWKAALTECFGTVILVYITIFISIHPPTPTSKPQTQAGVYSTAPFLGALIGGITNWIILTLAIYSFAPISGGHLNPTITIATFCARLTSFPRMVMYVAMQVAGGALAGLLVHASYGSREFVVGGCVLDRSQVTIGQAFTMEFMGNLVLLFFAFGLALDPRQAGVFGPKIAPFLVGLALGVISFGMSFSKPGGGVSGNGARCLGAFVASRFPSYHWIHWVGPIAAAVTHGAIYYIVPPWRMGTPLISGQE